MAISMACQYSECTCALDISGVWLHTSKYMWLLEVRVNDTEVEFYFWEGVIFEC